MCVGRTRRRRTRTPLFLVLSSYRLEGSFMDHSSSMFFPRVLCSPASGCSSMGPCLSSFHCCLSLFLLSRTTLSTGGLLLVPSPSQLLLCCFPLLLQGFCRWLTVSTTLLSAPLGLFPLVLSSLGVSGSGRFLCWSYRPQ